MVPLKLQDLQMEIGLFTLLRTDMAYLCGLWNRAIYNRIQFGVEVFWYEFREQSGKSGCQL
jgi:hypothetical protein